MDPVKKLWMFENWMEDQKENAELAKNHAYLLGSFWDPEAVKELMGHNTIKSSEDDFEKSTQIMLKEKQQEEANKKKKKRRKVKE